MSSMFKKKGEFAFKPKVPSARPRPAAPVVASQPSKAPTPAVQKEAQVQEQPKDTPETPPNSIPITDSSISVPVNVPEPPVEKPITPPPTAQEPATETETNQDSQNETRVDTPEIQTNSVKPAAHPPQEKRSASDEVALEPNNESSNHTEPEQERPQVTQRHPSPSSAPVDPLLEHVTIENARSEEPSTETFTTPVYKAPETQADATQVPKETASETPQPPTKKTPKPRAKRQTKAAQEQVGEDGEVRPKKRQRKAATETVDGEEQPKQPRRRKTATRDGQPRPRRARSVTPEDAETQVVDLQKLKMSDLTRDLHIGKKFSRHDELRERERKARLKAKLGKNGDLGEGADDASETTETQLGSAAKKDDSVAPPATSSSASAPPSGPQFRIVDGQIVVDQSSLVMDRHARAVAAQAGQNMETVEENDFTRLITSNSFMNTSKLRGPNIWSDAETELFYRGLRMFGTDFEIISKMFTGKQRRHVKLKFNREERHHPHRIDAVFLGEKTIKMDIDEYKAFTGSEFESVESIEAQQRKIQEDFEAQQQRVADEQAEIMRKKREELFADEDEANKKKGKKKGKQAVRYGLNGEPIAEGS